MADSASESHIQLHDITIRSPLPLPELLRHSSGLTLKFLVNGVGEVLTTHGDTDEGIWKVDGDIKIYEDQLLTAIILDFAEDSTNELGTVTASYSQLLAHAEAGSEEYYEFTVDGTSSSVPIFVTCSIKTSVPPAQGQRILTEPASDEGHINSNQAFAPDASSSTPDAADLERYYDQASDLPVERRSQTLNAIGCAYHRMYTTTNETAHLEGAITILGEALQEPNSDPGPPKYLDDLAICLLMRFGRTGNLDDIEQAISKSQDAAHIAETGDPNRHRYILHHANALLERFKRLGKLDDLQTGISFMNTATELVPDGHPDKPIYLNNLGNAFERRFDRLGRIEDMEMAIAHKQKAVDLTPDDDPDKPGRLNNLGNAFQMRFNRLGQVMDLEAAITYNQKAVDLTPDGHPDKPTYLNNLGKASQRRFDRLGRVEDLETAIAHKQKAVNLTPDGHPAKSGRLNNLGNAFERRFDRLGRLEDLEIAIAHKQKAVDLTPDDHPHKPAYLNNLGDALQAQFDRLGCLEDLEAAITHKQMAVDLTPDGHPHKSAYLNNLGNALETLFDQLGHLEDLEASITHKQKAIDLTPDGHPAKSSRLNNLGNAFERRFDRLGSLEDLEAAIAHKQKAVNLTPDGHPDKPAYLNNLGNALDAQFDRLGRVEDLEIALAHKQKAVDLTPDAHPDKARYLVMLGKVFLRRFVLLRQITDARMAVIQFSTAASLPTGHLRVRMNAARYWANTSEILETCGLLTKPALEPYHVTIDLLPRMAWLGIPMSTQHALLEDVGGIVREAVSTALRAEEYEIAVEWTEAGRSIVWQNLLNLRTPIDKLGSAHYDLSKRLETLSRQLDVSVRGGDDRMKDMTDGVAVSRSHVQLALDWNNTLTDIRSKPGFNSFLKPKDFNELGQIARNGPVVILNVYKDRCDALAIIPEDKGGVHISSLLLPGFTYVKSETLLKELKGLLSSNHLQGRAGRLQRPLDHVNGRSLGNILRCLWLDVIKPIIEALAYQPRSTDFPRIWWCATGPLAFLPIHAAGLYDTDEMGSKLSDYVVSSYTPTLSALLDDSTPSQDDFRLLAIAQANAPGAPPIPETEVEVKTIETLAKNINVATMTGEDATVENVWRGMANSSWVHLACHGHQNIKEPMKSGLLLHDGTLELQKLIEKPLPRADFAFLSAGQTATGDESVPEESLHLAAGMLFAGYKGVIATMWSIMDDIGRRVAEDVYREMLKDGKPNRKAAAHALHEAVRRLREDTKVDMLHWVPFIHIGL